MLKFEKKSVAKRLRIERTGRRGRRRTKLLDILNCTFKEDAFDRTLWRSFGINYGSTIRLRGYGGGGGDGDGDDKQRLLSQPLLNHY